MLHDTLFSFARASPQQTLAFVLFVAFTIGFFVWVAVLVKSK